MYVDAGGRGQVRLCSIGISEVDYKEVGARAEEPKHSGLVAAADTLLVHRGSDSRSYDSAGSVNKDE